MGRKLIINGGAIRPTGLLFLYSFLGMILINCQEMDLIELWSEMSGQKRLNLDLCDLFELISQKRCVL